MFKVGLTGGIGSGKSTVSQLFTELSVPVIDADDIAHQLVEPGQPVLTEIHNAFGRAAFQPDGRLDRNYLRDVIFSDFHQKEKLEAILHPRIFSEIQHRIDSLTCEYCIISIPLLFETRKTDFVDRILTVDCPVELQIARIKLRNGLTEPRIQTIIASQVSREYRIAHSDDIIDNSDSSAKLAERIQKLHNLYLSISTSIG